MNYQNIVVIKSLSHVQLFEIPWTVACQASLSPSPAFNLAQYQGLYQWFSSFTSGGQIIGASASVLWMNIQGWFPLGLTGWISLPAKGLSRVLSRTTVWRHQFFGTQPFFIVQLSHLYMTTGQPIVLTILTFVDNVMSLLLNTLSRCVIAFLPRSKCLLISKE